MFTSRIRTAAAGAAAEVQFARTAADLMARARKSKPTLLILDLGCARVSPLETIAAFKADPDLAATRIVGFVSHVEAELIAEARQAGIDEVMARSAFVSKLPALLTESR
jgi:PleD family two-component response regulator